MRSLTCEETENIRYAVRQKIPILDDAEVEALLRVIIGDIPSGPQFVAARTEVVARAMLKLADVLREMRPE